MNDLYDLEGEKKDMEEFLEEAKKEKGLTDQEKSLLLYQVMEWRIAQWESDRWIWHLIDENGDAVARREYHYPDMVESDVWDSFCLYLLDDFGFPLFMALAWRVHLWVLTFENIPLAQDYFDWFKIEYVWGQDTAQRLWLDKIVELAIEAGLPEVQDE